MEFDETLLNVQKNLQEQEIDGWLFYDFRRNNDLACQFLHIEKEKILTRRFFYWIPQHGKPVKVVHAIEKLTLDHLPGDRVLYRSWQNLEEAIQHLLKGKSRVAMEYSPRNAVPYVSKVDAGTIDVVRGFGVEVVSSADLLQKYTSVWDQHQLQTHLEAAKVLSDAVDGAWHFIEAALKKEREITEFDVQQWILEHFAHAGCVTADPPICAVNAHSADPHYSPRKESSSPIKGGDFILIDLWCKRDLPRAVYADITRVGVAAAEPTAKQQKIFSIVKQARDAGTDLVRSRFEAKAPIRGWEVDQACRHVIEEAGYGEFFLHRTGHNIGEADHGDGAHLDNLETQDLRELLPGTCFSIEPGIYLPGEFGVRLEYDVYVHPDSTVQLTGGVQESITCLHLP